MLSRSIRVLTPYVVKSLKCTPNSEASSKCNLKFCSSVPTSCRTYSSSSPIFEDIPQKEVTTTIVDDIPQKRITLSDEVIEKLGKDDATIKALKVIEFECNSWYDEGENIPRKLSIENWQELLIASYLKRKKYLRFIAVTENKKFNDIKHKKISGEKKRAAAEERRRCFSEINTSGLTDYGFSKNTIFLMMRHETEHRWYHNKVVQQMRFKNPVLFDMSYDDYMQRKEITNLAEQMGEVWQENRTHPEPLPITYVNLRPESQSYKALLKSNPRLCDDDYPIPITEKHYLDLYPKEKLIHLTPDGETTMKYFDDEAVYIVGGIVDKTCKEPLTLAKAKREGIRTMRLPLERYLPWGSSSKALALNHIMCILLKLRHTGSWEEALQFIPRRKLKSVEELAESARKEIAKKKILGQRDKNSFFKGRY